MKSNFFRFSRKSRGEIYLFVFTLLTGLILGSCENRIIPSAYRAEFPPPPPEWENVLGPPWWRVEWINPDGQIEILETDASSVPGLDIMVEWTTPVIAYPYWPERGIAPGILRPAGALFPFDAEKNRISLSWRGGIDAWVYLCLRDAGGGGDAGNRQPHYFDWPRFRLLMESSDIDEEVRLDPWLTDWQDVAARTVQSGFDRRRIKPAPREDLPVTIPQSGLYLGTSPFREPRFLEKDETALFPVTGNVDTYVTAQGLLRCTKGVWLWIPGEQPALQSQSAFKGKIIW
ncbi:MAG: hypothetical protein LBB78_00350 [Spirochaetaceae bacterium]|jgi:hypothetical protein|nr:hypothetical protein [Spirochaetaceae bacterium]